MGNPGEIPHIGRKTLGVYRVKMPNPISKEKTEFIDLNLMKLDFKTLFLPYINRCWNLGGPCAKGRGDLVEKTFQNGLNMTDD